MVYAIIDDTRLKGKIGNVTPVITDKKINFDVYLDYSQYTKLVPNLEVTLLIVTQHKDSVLRLEQGPAFSRNKRQDIYVVRGEKAVRIPVTTGLIGTDYIEIVSGLNAGDRVIISDTSPFRRRKEVDFKEM
jgi:HlyD family secretion protein